MSVNVCVYVCVHVSCMGVCMRRQTDLILNPGLISLSCVAFISFDTCVYYARNKLG